MNNKDLIGSIEKAGKTKRTMEFSCPLIKGFFVSLTYANRFVLQEIREGSKEYRFDRRTKERVEELNEEKLIEYYAIKLINDWRGLTARKLKDILPGLEVNEEDLDTNIAYNKEIAISILKNSLDFSSWVDSIATDSKYFTEIEKSQVKEYENLE